jgi:hypothetical protein
MRPKDLYPEQVFKWENYVYACGPCNGPKNSKFAVIDAAGKLVVVTRRRGAPVVPPAQGGHALIDPRCEDPLAFLVLDTVDTFCFTCWAVDKVAVEYLRGDYTWRLLGLNRDPLPKARRNAFFLYESQLRAYQIRRDEGAARPELDDRRDQFLQTPHPTVWAEMKRQRRLHPQLHQLLNDVPEALGW